MINQPCVQSASSTRHTLLRSAARVLANRVQAADDIKVGARVEGLLQRHVRIRIDVESRNLSPIELATRDLGDHGRVVRARPLWGQHHVHAATPELPGEELAQVRIRGHPASQAV